MKIIGYAAKAQGRCLEPFEYEAPKVGDTDVLVDITHCGLCYTDVHFIDNDVRMTQYPFVPGHEIVGVVAAAGKEVRALSEGQRVGIGFQRGSCGHCEWCVRMIAATIASLWPDSRNEGPVPARDGRDERRTVVQAVGRQGRHQEIGNFGVFRWAQANGGRVRG